MGANHDLKKSSSPSLDPQTVIAQAEQLLEKVTPGPWAWESIAEKSNEFAVGSAFDASGKPLAGRIPEGEWIEDSVIERRSVVGLNESGHANFADAEFICFARNHMRELLDTLARLTAREQPGDAVENVYRSEFGAALFNLYTERLPLGDQLFSQRATVVRRMIAAMLDTSSASSSSRQEG